MAWVQVGTKSSSNTWGSAPPIKINWTVTAYRDDETNNLKINGTISAVYVSGYFGYNITWGSWVISGSNMKSGTLKNNTPNTWTTVSASQEWSLGYNESETILCAASCASNSGRDAIHLSLTIDTPLLAMEPESTEDDVIIVSAGKKNRGIQLKSGNTNVYPITYFPVGAIYVSTSSTSPASLIGGSWTQLKDRFLLGAGSTYALGATGGAATVALTTSTMPAHSHSAGSGDGSISGSTRYNATRGTGSSTKTIYTEYEGSGTAHNNMPPYLVVYMWRRTA